MIRPSRPRRTHGNSSVFQRRWSNHTLANMRDHLQSLQEIQSHLAMGHTDVAAKIAETRLGMSSLGLHGAAEVSRYMPQEMQDAGTAMHRTRLEHLVIHGYGIVGAPL